MLDASPGRIAKWSSRFDYEFWQLRTPLTQYALSGRPYGLDNGCFSQFDETVWKSVLLDAYRVTPVFVCLPDVVGDAARTLDLFDAFKPVTENLPRALVIQDGIEYFRIPWDDIDAVFIGGTTEFKKSGTAINVCKVARMLGKWIHVGRVNTNQRISSWTEWADSFDGSGLSQFEHRLAEVMESITDMKPIHKLASKRRGVVQ